jgi:citrate synthase
MLYKNQRPLPRPETMMSILHDTLIKQAEALRATRTSLLKEHGETVLGNVTIEQVLGGMRGVPALVCDTSSVSADEGLRIRNIPILELTDITPEETFWLLVTGTRATADQLAQLRDIFSKFYQIPQYVIDTLKAMPKDSHPMAMLSVGLLAMERESEFRAAYDKGAGKDALWQSLVNDAVRLCASIPGIAAAIYRNNFAHMLGVSDDASWKELIRLYLVLHSDHEGGNVSAMTSYVVSSALSDPYYSVSAAMSGLAGPLHGLANQECLRFIMDVREQFGGVPTDEQLTEYTWNRLNNGQVVPGYGHAVLRVTDPRFTAFYDFGVKHGLQDDNVQLVQKLFKLVPGILKEHGKAKNPWPNVDAASGALLYAYGMTEFDFYTVMFGVSRAIGLCSQMVVNRMMNSPIVRPKSMTLAELTAKA